MKKIRISRNQSDKTDRRLWIYLGEYTLCFEPGKLRWFGFSIEVGGYEGDQILLSLHCWFSFYISLSHRKFYKWPGWEVGVTYQPREHVLMGDWFSDSREMDSSKGKFYIDIFDKLFGRSIYSESQHGSKWHLKHVDIELPEGKYTLAMDFYTSYWHRPRSIFVRSIPRVDITPDRPVGIPGKGENSWDIDEDATFSSTQPVRNRTPEQIAEDFKQDILQTRERRAGRNWKPERNWQHPATEPA